MSENILQKIIDQKKIKIEKLKREIDIDSLIEIINEKDIFFDFKKKIQTNNSENKISIIAYQDGEQVSKQPGFEFQKKWVLNEISIGANSHSERRRTFNGSFAIVRVYDKALTEDQINENIQNAFTVEAAGRLSTAWARIKEQY